MKKIVWFGVLAALSLTSCRQEKEVGDKEDIVGSWKLTHVVTISTKTNTILNTYQVEGCEAHDIYEYTEDKKLNLTKFSPDANGDCISGQQLQYGYKYNPEAKRLTWYFDGGNYEQYDLRLLKDNQLELKYYPTDIDSDGYNDTVIKIFRK